MDDDLNLDAIEQNSEEKLKVKNRFQTLSDKVVSTSQERDEALNKLKAEADTRAQVEKERDFFKDFSQNASKFPQAAEYQDKIFEKVKGGYSTEDAMYAVLAKEGKLNTTTEAPAQQTTTVEGGSASTSFAGDKALSDMTPAEKLAKLSELNDSGELGNALRGLR